MIQTHYEINLHDEQRKKQEQEEVENYADMLYDLMTNPDPVVQNIFQCMPIMKTTMKIANKARKLVEERIKNNNKKDEK